MTLPACDNCGNVDSRRMIGLMTVFFGPLLELPEQPGYFYVCPRCYDQLIVPHLDDVRALLRKHHPAEGDSGEARGGDDA